MKIQKTAEASDTSKSHDLDAKKIIIPKKEIYKRLLMLAIPIALQNLLAALLNIVDSTMVQSLGEAQMGAVLLVNQFIFIYQVIIFSIAGAGVVFISQYFGKGDTDKIASCFTVGSILVLFIALVFTFVSLFWSEGVIRLLFNPKDASVLFEAGKFLQVVAWSFLPFGFASLIGISLRGMRKVIMPLIVSASVILINLFFNYAFMFGKLGFPQLYIKGAALGTVISRVIELLTLAIVVFVKKYPIISNLKNMFAITKSYLKKFIRVFIPACANEIFWVVGTSIYLFVFAQMDNSQSVLAAVNMTQAVDKIVFVVLVGLGNSAGIIVGHELGANNPQKAQILAKYSLIFAVLAGVGVGIITGLSGFALPLIYNNVTSESLQTARYLLIVFGIAMPIRAVTFTLFIGILRAGGDTIFCMILETITIWGIAVPLVLVMGLVLGWNVILIYCIIYTEEMIKMIIVTLRFKSKKWTRNLVKNEQAT